MEIINSYELKIRMGDAVISAFIQGGFFSKNLASMMFHNHHYPEIHIVSGGAAIFTVGNKKIEVSDGEVILIPAGELHLRKVVGERTRVSSFQIDVPTRELRKCTMSRAFLDDFFAEIMVDRTTLDGNKMSAYIQIICANLLPELSERLKRMSDAAFIIHEFIVHNYTCDSRLSDLAAGLHLSEKQTARLVETYTGKTFKQAILEQRMNTARYLMERGDMSFTEIGSYLGYQSYGGFYKAYSKYFGEEGCLDASEDEK